MRLLSSLRVEESFVASTAAGAFRGRGIGEILGCTFGKTKFSASAPIVRRNVVSFHTNTYTCTIVRLKHTCTQRNRL